MEHRSQESKSARTSRASWVVFISLVRDDGGWSKGREKNRKEHSGSVSLRNGALEDRIGHKSVKERKTRLHSRDVFGLIMFEVPL